ncbi:hypothetical protein, partial [Streptomyces griseocarneus]|uniref:hypothetical protein n=1 Tax=Streptomyces griseocarneus TaxID=51201 RepID=UPI001CCB9B51
MSSTPSQRQDETGLDQALQNVTESLAQTDGKAALRPGHGVGHAVPHLDGVLIGGSSLGRA